MKGTETGYQVLERRGKKFTRVEMTFVVDIKGVDCISKWIDENPIE